MSSLEVLDTLYNKKPKNTSNLREKRRNSSIHADLWKVFKSLSMTLLGTFKHKLHMSS